MPPRSSLTMSTPRDGRLITPSKPRADPDLTSDGKLQVQSTPMQSLSYTTTPCPPRNREVEAEPDGERVDENSNNGSDNVRVAVRVRPLNTREKSAAVESKYKWEVNSKSITQSVNGKKIASNMYNFDNVFQPPADNQQIFETIAKPVVSSAVEGINGVIFAYGQTAAGKTHTMLGNEADRGVTPQSIQAVFDAVMKCTHRTFLLRASYIEIYNEVIRDLLLPANDNLKIHEDSINKRVFVDAKEEIVTSVDQVMQIIAAGEHSRAVGETNMNDRSSRSHTIFSLKIESREMTSADVRQRRQTQAFQNGEPIPEDDEDDDEDDAANDGVAVRASSLSLVDLAGSERASFTKAQGMRLVEGGHINKSLLTLGNVINKLSSGEAKLAHIPYRDSKLTRLLQPALGGNARTAIICAVTPAILHMEETISTLKFASRAKKVTNSAKTNEFLDDRAKLRRAERRIKELEQKLLSTSSNDGNGYMRTPNASLRYSGGTSDGNESPSSRKSFSSAARASLIKRGEKRFKLLLETIKANQSENGGSQLNSGFTFTPPRKRRRVASPLHLMPGPAANQMASSENSEDDNEKLSASAEAEMAGLRKRAFAAEKEKRVALSEIKYEREAHQREVSQLVGYGQEVSRQRDLAEQECSEMHLELSRATSRSLVDEVLSNAVDRAQLNTQLRVATISLQQMDIVKDENSDLKQTLVDKNKQLVEFSKRERRGIGPVKKECELAQKKLADAELKLRAAKQQASQATAEKARLERETKGKDRQLKMYATRTNQQTRREESRFETRLRKELAEAKKKTDSKAAQQQSKIDSLEKDLKTRTVENQRLKTDLHDSQNRLQEVTNNLNLTIIQKTEVEKARDLLRDDFKLVSDSQDGLTKEFNEMRDKLANEQNEKSQLQSAMADYKMKSEAEVSHLQTKVAELDITLNAANGKVAQLSTELEGVKTKLKDTETQLMSTVTKLSVAEKERDETCEKLETQRNEMQLKVTAAEDTVKNTTAELEGARQKLQFTEEELVSTTSKMLDVESAFDEAREELKTAKKSCVSFESQLAGAKKEASRLETEVATMGTKLSTIIDEKQVLSNECERLKEAVKSQLTEIKVLQEIKATHDASEEQFLKAVDDNSRLETDVSTLHKKLSVVTEEKQTLSGECSRLSERCLSQQDEIRHLQHQFKESVQLKDDRIESTERRLLELEQALKEKNEHMMVVQQRVDSDIQLFESRISGLQEKLSSAHTERKKKSNEVERLNTLVRCQQNEIARIQQAHEDSLLQMEMKREGLQRALQDKENQMNQALSKAKDDRKWSSLVKKAQAELQDRQRQLEAKEAEITKAQEGCVHWKEIAQKAMKEKQKREQEKNELELKLGRWTSSGGEIAELKSRLSWRDSKIASLERHNDRLRNQLTERHPHIIERDIQRMQAIETHNESLQREKDTLADKVKDLENLCYQLKDNVFELRERIKSDAIRRVQKSIEYQKGILNNLDINRQAP